MACQCNKINEVTKYAHLTIIVMPQTPELTGALPPDPTKGPKTVPLYAHLTVIKYLKPKRLRGLCPLTLTKGPKAVPCMLI